MNEDLNDDASTYGCPYINNVGNAREVVPKIWEKYDSWREEIYKPISESVSVSEADEKAADFHTFQMMTDTAVDEGFEGIFAEKDYYTDEQWLTTNKFQRAWLSDDWDKNSRDILVSPVSFL